MSVADLTHVWVVSLWAGVFATAIHCVVTALLRRWRRQQRRRREHQHRRGR
jgi:hypothetical protein